MTLLRFHCPVCGAPCEVSDASASRTRCEQCGLLFVPTAPNEAESQDTQARAESPVPMPPSVIYTTFANYVPRPEECDAPSATPEDVPSGAPRSEAASMFPAADAPDAGPAHRAAAPPRPAGILGPPPPYRPIAVPPKPTPGRDQIAPAAPTAEGSNRVAGALGPPPPYRPVIQAGPVFGRGPAPDLEPWRPVSFTRIQIDRRPEPETPVPGSDDDDFAWSLPREAPPEPPIGAAPREAVRLEIPGDFGPRDRPLVWPRGQDAPYDTPETGQFSPPPDPTANLGVAVRPSLIRRVVRLTLWAGGIGVAVIAVVMVLYVGRWRIMRMVPASIPIYATLQRVAGAAGIRPDQR